jgi:hypothetical protein
VKADDRWHLPPLAFASILCGMSRGLQMLESVMRERELSRGDVARACGTGADVVSRWFSAQPPRKPSKPSRSLSVKLEQLYGIPVPSWDEPAESTETEQGAA